MRQRRSRLGRKVLSFYKKLSNYRGRTGILFIIIMPPYKRFIKPNYISMQDYPLVHLIHVVYLGEYRDFRKFISTSSSKGRPRKNAT
jgi:hypothetical protein